MADDKVIGQVESEGPTNEALLVEYQAAQDSAQHHDNMIWSATGIVWGASLILLGFILEGLAKNADPGTAKVSVSALSLAPLAVSPLAIVLLTYLWYAACVFASVKNQKYARCKEIELLLGLRQHSTLRMPKYRQRILYGIAMGLFIATWFGVFIYTLINCLHG